jgi:hypothetical protein
MTTALLKVHARVFLLSTALALPSLLNACNGGSSPTAVEPPTAQPTPSISGAWQGSFNPGLTILGSCGRVTELTATFSQAGKEFQGTLSVPADSTLNGATLQGVFRYGTQIQGTFWVGANYYAVSGSASENRITWSWPGTLFCPKSIVLER